MQPDEQDQRLSRISTVWSDLAEAHGGGADAAAEARRRLVLRYVPAARRYLLAALRDPAAADDLAQEFALRLARGDFRRADPDRGRFRDLVKSAVFRLIVDHQRGKARDAARFGGGPVEVVAAPPGPPDADREFQTVWLAELMRLAWDALARHERESRQPLHTVLRLRTDEPDLSAPELAERLSARVGRPVSPEWVYKRLHQARQAFADLLVGEVARSLADPTPDGVEAELIDLGLLDRCRQALGRWRGAWSRRAGRGG